jgi:predicted nucleic acid-binding protein
VILLDSNVYIRAFLRTEGDPRFLEFHRANLPRIVLSAVVIHELLVGALTPDRRRRLQRGLIEPFRARRRIHTPSLSTWELAATLDVALRAVGPYAGSLGQRSFGNDLLLAATVRELGATLITENTTDFELIGRVVPLQVAKAWPLTAT